MLPLCIASIGKFYFISIHQKIDLRIETSTTHFRIENNVNTTCVSTVETHVLCLYSRETRSVSLQRDTRVSRMTTKVDCPVFSLPTSSHIHSLLIPYSSSLTLVCKGWAGRGGGRWKLVAIEAVEGWTREKQGWQGKEPKHNSTTLARASQ